VELGRIQKEVFKLKINVYFFLSMYIGLMAIPCGFFSVSINIDFESGKNLMTQNKVINH
jgi:hypothetical protein